MPKTVDFTGTVSHATMRPQDVLPAIMGVLGEFYPSAFNSIRRKLAFGANRSVYSAMCADGSHPSWDHEDVSWIINELAWDAMNEIAPERHYFGAHPGDGTDYGFWAIEEE